MNKAAIDIHRRYNIRFAYTAAAILLTLLAALPARAADAVAFKVGQMWTIKNSAIRIVIGRIEPFLPNKTAIHVSVLDVPCPRAAGCTTTVVAHAPFDEAALAASVDQKVSDSAPVADAFESGYAQWKTAKGGVFTIPVSELPNLLFKALGSGARQPG